MNDVIEKIKLLLEAKKVLQKYDITTKLLDEMINDYLKYILEVKKLC